MDYFKGKELSLKDIINSLGLERINVLEIEHEEDYSVVTICGGFNGAYKWDIYLHQIGMIFSYLSSYYEYVWVIDLNNDCPNDVWHLRLGIRNYK